VPSFPGEEHPLTLEEVLATLRSLERKLQGLAAKEKQSPRKGASSSLTRLTPRQIEILRALALGYSTREVALLLGVSTNTVETHRRLIMRKLNLPSFAHLVRAAVFLGLVPENPWEDSRNP
jgi:DNA-binding CsgD family transcriptional regulator